MRYPSHSTNVQDILRYIIYRFKSGFGSHNKIEQQDWCRKHAGKKKMLLRCTRPYLCKYVICAWWWILAEDETCRSRILLTAVIDDSFFSIFPEVFFTNKNIGSRCITKCISQYSKMDTVSTERVRISIVWNVPLRHHVQANKTAVAWSSALTFLKRNYMALYLQ